MCQWLVFQCLWTYGSSAFKRCMEPWSCFIFTVNPSYLRKHFIFVYSNHHAPCLWQMNWFLQVLRKLVVFFSIYICSTGSFHHTELDKVILLFWNLHSFQGDYQLRGENISKEKDISMHKKEMKCWNGEMSAVWGQKVAVCTQPTALASVVAMMTVNHGCWIKWTNDHWPKSLCTKRDEIWTSKLS